MRACIYARMYVCIYVDVKAFRRENPKRLKPLDQKRLEVEVNRLRGENPWNRSSVHYLKSKAFRIVIKINADSLDIRTIEHILSTLLPIRGISNGSRRNFQLHIWLLWRSTCELSAVSVF